MGQLKGYDGRVGLFSEHTITLIITRRLAYPSYPYPSAQDPVRHHPRHFAGDIMDSHKHHLHGRFIYHVPLGARHTL